MPPFQFGETHERITKFFEKSSVNGFTGTIHLRERSKNDLGKRTTKDLLGNVSINSDNRYSTKM
jgi:type I restriction enzyme R subunit